MKEVLVYGNRKQDDMIWDVSTPELRYAAFLKLFYYLHDEWDVYSASPLKPTEQALFEKARLGDSAAAERLLTKRSSYEYEEWRIVELEN